MLPKRVADWPEAWRVEFDERAALVEDGCKVPRREAERLAEAVVRRMQDPDAPPVRV